MGDYRLPARLRCWHPTLRSRLGPLQPEAYLHSGARGVRNRLVVLRPGPEPLVPGLRTHLAGRGGRGGARFSERVGRQGAAARAPRDGSWFDLLQRRGRSRGRPGCGWRGGFHAGLALSLLRDAAAHATPDTLRPPRTAAHRVLERPKLRPARRYPARAGRWAVLVRDHAGPGRRIRLVHLLGSFVGAALAAA